MKTVKTGMPNGIIFLLDSKQKDIFDGSLGQFMAFHGSVGILATHEQEGETTLSLGDDASFRPNRIADFYTVIATPSRLVEIINARAEVLLDWPVTSDRTSVSIWINSAYAPDDIMIGIKAADPMPQDDEADDPPPSS